MESVLDAMDAYGDAPPSYLDQQTGKVEVWIDPEFTGEEPDFDLDDDRWVEVPRREAREAHGAMQDFAASVDEADIQQLLNVALAGKGAFGRFRAVLAAYPDLRTRWEAKDRAALLQRANAWFAELDIEPRYELQSVSTVAPVPATPTKAHLTLTDLLLLGSPNGKTELLDGRVFRQYIAASAAEARKAFASLAREITEQQGIGWRKRMVEGRDDFELGRYHLVVKDRLVGLQVVMQRAMWDEFKRT